MALVAATAAHSSSTAGSRDLPRLSGPARTTTTTSKAQHRGGGVATTTVPGTVPTGTAAELGGGTGAGAGAGAGTAANVAHLPAAATTTVPVTAAPATTTTTTGAGAGSTVYPGYLQPPVNSSTTYAFTGQGPTRITVTWSNGTYLTMAVSCSGFSQNTGGSSALSMSIPDAQGACQATLAEPASETVTLSYTLTITPGSG